MKEVKEKRKWRIADIGNWFKNAFMATIKGEFLLRLNVSKYFIHIIYTFLLFWISIYLSLKIEKSMTKVEDNRKVLQEMEIYHAQKTVKLVSLGRLSNVKERLEQEGSSLDEPEKPATIIKK